MADAIPDERRLALCGGCRKIARCRFGITSELLDADGIAHFAMRCPDEHEGSTGTAHGGWTSAVLEEVLGRIVYLHGLLSVAGSLSITFHHPVPMGLPLSGRSWVVERTARKWHLAGELLLPTSGAILASATGVSVLVDAEAHATRFDEWLRRQQAN